ncbi:MAG: hypothetical protein DRG27_06780, partial [Deltaproteobacteria bacterium]
EVKGKDWRGNQWEDTLIPRIRICLKGTHEVKWESSISSIAEGKVKVDITLLVPCRERIIGTVFFNVPQIEAESVGSETCKLCHNEIYEAWNLTKHAPAIGCESCHGAGSEHIATLSSDFIIIDPTPELCATCHSLNNGETIEAAGGFIKNMQQYNEWKKSPHAGVVSCVSCHNPHFSLTQVPEQAIKKDCRDCHVNKNVELGMQSVNCIECHMPFAVYSNQSTGQGMYKKGDVRSHIIRINTVASPKEMFSYDGKSVAEDSKGSFLTLDFACLSCHNGMDARFYDFDAVQKTSTLIH